MISLGAYHACVLPSEREASCWGVNTDGQVGSGRFGNPEFPGVIVGGLLFEQISLGFGHSCGLTEDGDAYCWGSNGGGILGTGMPGASAEPLLVTGNIRWLIVSGGGTHTCGVSDAMAAYCWGSNQTGQLGLRGLAPDCGGTCAATPQLVEAAFAVSTVTTGATHTCALTTDSVGYCWGSNADGQLGNGTLVSSPLPVLVQGGLRFKALDAGGNHTCGLLDDGTAFCWGRDDDGQLGAGLETQECAVTGAKCSTSPLAVETTRTFAAISAGGKHTCALTPDGTAHCWGNNRRGQLGNGEVFNVPVPQQVLGSNRLQSISAGEGHTCGVSADADVFCWGDNFRGQLGNGSGGFRFVEPQFILSLREQG